MTDGEKSTRQKASAGDEKSPLLRFPSAVLRGVKRAGRALLRVPLWLKRVIFSRQMFAFLGSLCFTFALFAIIGLIYYASLLPDISGLAAAKEQPGVEVFSEDGTVLARYGQITGEYITYRHLPQHLIDAVIATEDRRFFSHYGVDPRGIARAMVTNIRQRRLVQGGSTITQQLAKNIFLTPDRELSRKIQELMMAFWLEHTFSKEEIITIYLNRVYMGGGNYGVDAASRYYFDKSVAQLDLVESAMIAGLLKAPSLYNPTANTELAKKRTTQVLVNMVNAQKITREEADAAIESLQSGKYYVRTRRYDSDRYFADWVVELLPDYIGALKEDIIVTTTLDTRWQKAAQESIDTYMDEKARKDRKVSDVAMLAMRPDGAVVSMIGGRDYNESQYNRATQARRQPGSAFKLFVYLAAVERGYWPDTYVVDKPVRVGKWQPRNYGNRYRGEITLRDALTHSVNTVAVQLSQTVGIPAVRNVARRLGVVSQIPDVPSVALGAVEMTLTEMVTAYAHLAHHGRAVRPYGIIEVRRKKDGKILYARGARDDISDVVVVSEANVAKMNTMLANVITSGTAKAAQIGRSAAGKTGTTSGYRDAWFVGYTPHLVAGVWVGNDNAKATAKVTGGSIPARIWRAYMKAALKDIPAAELPVYVYETQPLPWREGIDAPNTGVQPPSAQPPAQRPVQRRDGYDLEPSFWEKLFEGDASQRGGG